MTDDIRTRIAKAIAGAVYGHNTLETVWADLHEDAQDQYFAEADAVIRELGLREEHPVSMSDYAAHLCQFGCDCSCCYGMDNCYHTADPCNCGKAAKEHCHD